MTFSQNQIVKYSTFLTILYVVFLSAPTTNGGLLSSIIRQNRNFHYVVQRIFDKENEIGVGSSSEENVIAIKEKGTATLQSSSSSEGFSSSSVLLRMQTSYSDCGSAAAIKNLLLNPCANSGGNSDICEIERGSNVTFNLSFVPKRNATQLKTVIHGIVDYVPIPLPCPEPDACQNSGLSCPILAGSQYDYVLSAQVKDSYPKMKLWVKGQLEDEDERNVICVKIHIHIV